MRKIKMLLLGYIGIVSINVYGQCSKDYQLTWYDEFDATSVDLNKWVPQKGGGGFGNQEIQYYKPENATVSDGLLHIKIKKDTVLDGSTTYNYSSAKLQTLSKANFQYGRIESRIKMPSAIGSWPAFWMLGSNIETVPWPHCGEVDIMEWVGRGPNAATGSIFFDGVWPNNHLSTPYNIPQGQSFITDFHTFAIEWEPNEIRYYCDGNHYATYTPASIAPKEWLFNHEFYLILNCAIGGTGGGSVVTIPEPQYMEIDYVRVYSLPSTADSIKLSGPKSLMQNSQNVLFKTAYFPNTTYNWSLPNSAFIADGAGTNAIHVNFAKEGGKVKVTATNSCTSLSDSLALTLLADTCKIVYDNFEDTVNVTYKATGTLTETFANPSSNNVNSSAYVGKYQRNSAETYDVLGVNDIALESALGYENGSRVFYLDIYTSAPVNTQITLQLENSSLNTGAYPQGRRSSYIGKIAKQNEWHTVQFKFNQIISTGTLPDQIDHVALLFDPGHQTSDVYYIDNFRRIKTTSECTPVVTGIDDIKIGNTANIYPNPVNNILYISNKNKNSQFSVYDALGQKVLENKGDNVDVSHLPNGIYLLKSENNTFKFIKE